MPLVCDLLTDKDDRPVQTVHPDASVLEAVRKMNAHRIGAVVVVDPSSGRPCGIFTERDVLRLVGALQDIVELGVRDVMTRDVAFVRQDTDLDDVSSLMKEKRIRHLPVLDGDDRLRSMVSIGDINAFYSQHHSRQLEHLTEYIHGRC